LIDLVIVGQADTMMHATTDHFYILGAKGRYDSELSEKFFLVLGYPEKAFTT